MTNLEKEKSLIIHICKVCNRIQTMGDDRVCHDCKEAKPGQLPSAKADGLLARFFMKIDDEKIDGLTLEGLVLAALSSAILWIMLVWGIYLFFCFVK